MSESPLDVLMGTIADRKATRPPDSYTTRLFDGGVERIGRKVAEEAAEVVEAAGEPGETGRAHLLYEAGDLVYHLFVMLAARDLTLADLEGEIARRFGVSGLAEKASRGKPPA